MDSADQVDAPGGRQPSNPIMEQKIQVLGEKLARRSSQSRKESVSLVAELQVKMEQDSTDDRSSVAESADESTEAETEESKTTHLDKAWDRVRTRISSVSARRPVAQTHDVDNDEARWTASDTDTDSSSDFDAEFDSDSETSTIDSEELGSPAPTELSRANVRGASHQASGDEVGPSRHHAVQTEPKSSIAVGDPGDTKSTPEQNNSSTNSPSRVRRTSVGHARRRSSRTGSLNSFVVDLATLTPIQLKRIARECSVPIEMFPRRSDLQMHMQELLADGKLGSYVDANSIGETAKDTHSQPPTSQPKRHGLEERADPQSPAAQQPDDPQSPTERIRAQVARMRERHDQLRERHKTQKQQFAARRASWSNASQGGVVWKKKFYEQQESTLSFAPSPRKSPAKNDVHYFHDVLSAMYVAFDPTQLDHVSRQLQDWKGREEELVQRVRGNFQLTHSRLDKVLQQYRSLQTHDNRQQRLPDALSTNAAKPSLPRQRQQSQTGLICPYCRTAFGVIGDLLTHVPTCTAEGSSGGSRVDQIRKSARSAPNTPVKHGHHALLSPPKSAKERERMFRKQQKAKQKELLRQQKEARKLPRLKREDLFVEEMPLKPANFPNIVDWSREFAQKKKPVDAALKELARGRRALPENGAFLTFKQVDKPSGPIFQSPKPSKGPPKDVTTYICRADSPMVDKMHDEKTKALTMLQNERDLAKIKWTLQTLKQRIDAFKMLKYHDIVEESLRQLVSGQVCQVAINIRSFCKSITDKYEVGSEGAKPSCGNNALVLQEVQSFVAVQAKSLFKLETSLAHQTQPKCPTELLRTQFFLKVEVETLKQVRHTLRSFLRDERADRIDSAFVAIKHEIAEIEESGRTTENGVAMTKAFLLGVKNDLAGEPGSFGPAVEKLERLASSYGQPSRQLIALMELVETINSIAVHNVEAAYAKRGKKSKAASLMADDFLPLLMFVLLSCGDTHVTTPYSDIMNSIQLLGQPRFLRGAAMYYVTSFDSAMNYLASDEFRNNVRQACLPPSSPDQ